MDRKYIDDHHIVARYLAEQLPDAEREAFEAYYVEHPDVVQDMEAAARLKVGLAQLRDAGKLDTLLKPRSWYRDQRFLAAAAVAAVAVGVGLVVMRSPSMQPLLVASSGVLHDWRGARLPLASTHTVLRTRSISYDAEIELPPSAQAVELRVLPEYETQPPRYRIALQAIADDDSLRPVAEIGGLTPGDDGFVPVFLNATRIAPGRYQLTLTGDAGTSAASEESSFLIRFRAPGEGGQQY
jgi:hypothetical protein